MKYTRRQIVEALRFWRSLLDRFGKREAPDFSKEGDEIYGPALSRAVEQAEIPGVKWAEVDVDENVVKAGLAPGVRSTTRIRQALQRAMSAVVPVDVFFDGRDRDVATFSWLLR